MKPGFLIGLTIALLCLLDVAATHYEVATLGVTEANLLMVPVIAQGWAGVWALKVTLAVVVALTGAAVWRTLAGKGVMLLALAGNVVAGGCHLVLALCVGR